MDNNVVERIKEIISSLISENGLGHVKSLGPVSFYFKGIKYIVEITGSEDEISINIARKNLSSTHDK